MIGKRIFRCVYVGDLPVYDDVSKCTYACVKMFCYVYRFSRCLSVYLAYGGCVDSVWYVFMVYFLLAFDYHCCYWRKNFVDFG